MSEALAPAPIDPHNLSPLGLPAEEAGPNFGTDFLAGVDMTRTYDVAPANRVAHMQDPFGLKNAQPSYRFAAIRAESTATAPTIGVPTAAEAGLNIKAPTAAEMAQAEEAQFMARAKKAAREAIDAYAGYDTQAALAAKISEVNAETEKQQLVAAAAAQAEQQTAVQRRLIDEADNANKGKKKGRDYTYVA